MARLPRLCLPGIPQHIIQRGTNHQACFASEEDFAAYAFWLDDSAKNYDVAIHAWVFMTGACICWLHRKHRMVCLV